MKDFYLNSIWIFAYLRILLVKSSYLQFTASTGAVFVWFFARIFINLDISGDQVFHILKSVSRPNRGVFFRQIVLRFKAQPAVFVFIFKISLDISLVWSGDFPQSFSQNNSNVFTLKNGCFCLYFLTAKSS